MPARFDAHMHVYGGRPQVAAPFTVPNAGLEDYRRVMAALDITRVLVVQSMLYGTDNAVMLDAVAQLGPETARGVAVITPDASEALCDDLAASGVVGLRAFLLKGGVLNWDDLPRLAFRAAERDWQLHLQCDGAELSGRLGLLNALPCRLVIDHVGKFLTPVLPRDPAFQALCALVGNGRTWVKISGLYETSRIGAPGYDDVAALARQLIGLAPDRVLWATNWPHPNHMGPADDAALTDVAERLAPDAASRRALMHDNAAALCGFPPALLPDDEVCE
ncbi:MAG: amidohydrolase family protein [Rhodobacteraceae bacterium]|jgi:D-galactarolactone isomerase|nr:amidohydrolase family protein [Paracoccaceae bacterium]